jgi:hypothetical protein
MATDRLDDDGAPHTEPHVYDWEDIGAMLENEGFEEGVARFKVTEVPKEGRPLWAKALRLRKELQAVERQIDEFLPTW